MLLGLPLTLLHTTPGVLQARQWQSEAQRGVDPILPMEASSEGWSSPYCHNTGCIKSELYCFCFCKYISHPMFHDSLSVNQLPPTPLSRRPSLLLTGLRPRRRFFSLALHLWTLGLMKPSPASPVAKPIAHSAAASSIQTCVLFTLSWSIMTKKNH